MNKGDGSTERVQLDNPTRKAARSSVARVLQSKFKGAFGYETVEATVFDSFNRLATRATVTTWLVVGAERFARERLEALVHADDPDAKKIPAVLFLCVHNAGRSEMVLGGFNRLGGARAIAWSAGSFPESELNQGAVAAMAEVGIDISREFPKP